MGRIICLSDGLQTNIGRDIIKKQLKDQALENKKIYLFYEPHYSVVELLKESCKKLGFKEDNIFLSENEISKQDLKNMDFIYVTDGNTFEILKVLQEKKLLKPIRAAVANGTIYIGSSAGAMIAGKDIALAKDKNTVNLQDLEALKLFDGTVIPHYTKNELRKYIWNTDPNELKKYQKIYQVSNGGVLLIG